MSQIGDFMVAFTPLRSVFPDFLMQPIMPARLKHSKPAGREDETETA
jgi:hypothetical protein